MRRPFSERKDIMKILVLAKIAPDYDEILPEDWDNIQSLDTTYVKKIYDCFDEGALEAALRLKEQYSLTGMKIQCTAFISGEKSQLLLTGLYAAGFDRVIYAEGITLWAEALPSMNEWLCREQFDLILTGRQDGIMADKTAAPFLAAMLHYPWLQETVSVTMGDGPQILLAETETKDSYEKVRLQLPYICSFGNAAQPSLRLFSLKARMEAKKKTVEQFEVDRPETEKVKIVVKRKEKVCQMTEQTEEEAGQQLFEMIKKGR